MRLSSMTPLLPLIGRSTELATLDAQLVRGGITIIQGPPGVGKTHFARHCVETRWISEGRRRFAWLDATHCADTEALGEAIAATLGIPESASDAAASRSARLKRVARSLASHGPSVLVLDHLDHLAESSAELLMALHKGATEARILVTSRTRVPLELATTMSLAPLALPNADGAEDVKASAAVQLLLHRASRYRFRDEDAASVAALVRELDGLPLALELAARRLSVLSPRALLERLTSQLDVLHAPALGSGQAIKLREVIHSSWRDLAGAEKRLLTQCSVFRGGFDIAALEAVSNVDDPADLPLDLLSALIDRSLVLELDTAAGERRFSLLESIRQFAFEQLAADELGVITQRHAEYFAEAKVDAEDLDNLLHAYAHASALPAEVGASLRVRLLLALEPWVSGQSANDRLARLDETLRVALPREDLSPAHLAKLLYIRGAALQQLGRNDEAERDLREGLDRLGDLDAELRVLLTCQLGSLHQAQGELAKTAEAYARAQKLVASLRRPELEGRVHFGLGVLAHSQGKLDDARQCYELAADRYRVCGARDAEAETLAYLGALLLQRGRLQEARARYRDALSIRGQAGDAKLTAMLLGNLAILEQEEGRFDHAREHLQHGLSAAQHIGERRLEGRLLGYRGCLAHEAGELPTAQRAYEHALAVLREVGDLRLEAIFLACSGAVHAQRGLADAAHEAFDAAAKLLEASGDEGALAAVSVHRAQLLVLRGREGNDSASARALYLEAVREQCAAVRRDALFAASDDLRFAVRLLEKAIDADACVVELDEGGVLTLIPPGGELQDLSTRGPLRRLVASLVEQRMQSPGAPLSTSELIDAAWPNERVGVESGMNRLKVALATLRKMGMRDLIQRKDGGYLFDPAVQLRVRRGDA